MGKTIDEKNIQTVRGFFAALEHGKIEEIDPFLANDVILSVNSAVPEPFKGIFTGIEAVKNHLTQCSMQLVPNSDLYVMRDVTSKEGMFAIEWGRKGSANKQDAFNNYTVLLEVKADKINSLMVYVET